MSRFARHALLLGIAAVSVTCNAEKTTGPRTAMPPVGVVGTTNIDGTGLNLNQVLVSSGLPATRSVIAQSLFRPSIAVLSSGELIAAMLLPGYVDGNENVMISRSADGNVWSAPAQVLPGRDPNLFRLRDGTLLLSHFTLATDTRFPGRGFISTSSDDGHTWKLHEITPDLIPLPSARVATARGFVQLPSGEVLAFVAAVTGSTVTVYVLRSRDFGQSWSPGDLAFRNADEVSVVRLSSGRILAAVRLDGPNSGLTGDSRQYQSWVDTGHPTDQIHLTQSDDDGHTWAQLQPVLPPSAVPAHLLLLTDGRVVMTYGVRFWPRGVQAVVSGDGGRTWAYSRRYILCWHSENDDTGYPWSVEMTDGSIMTAYYARRQQRPETRSPDDVFAEVIRWTAN